MFAVARFGSSYVILRSRQPGSVDHGLHQRVIEHFGHRPDQGADALKLEILVKRDQHVLAPSIGVAYAFPEFNGKAFTLAALGRQDPTDRLGLAPFLAAFVNGGDDRPSGS